MQTIVRGGPADIIAYAWFRMGYRPRESVVLVGIRGPRQRTGVVARADLPPPAHRRAAVLQLASMLVGRGDDAVIALIVSDAPVRGARPGEAGLPHRGLVKVVRTQARRCGLDVIDVLAVGPHTYRSYLCTDEACCPATGQPLSAVMGSRMAAEMVLDGRALADGEDGLIADVLPVDCPDDAPADPPAGTAATDHERLLHDWISLLTAARRHDPAEPERDAPAWLAGALAEPRFRDAVIVTLVSPCAAEPADGEAVAFRLLDEEGAREAQEDLDQLFACAVPDTAWLEAGRRVLAATARRAPAGRRADALAVLAWISWWSGTGARGRLLADRALADQPGHRLASLVAALLSAAVAPEWAAFPDEMVES